MNGAIHDLAEQHDLEVYSSGRIGLVEKFAELKSNSFDSHRVDPRVAEFYERTASYEIDAWAQWNGVFTTGYKQSTHKQLSDIDLSASPEAIPVRDWRRQELDKRRENLQKYPESRDNRIFTLPAGVMATAEEWAL